jgi:glutamate/tyrosine decarboxylase-like PLP-dependent enzyme
MHDAYFVFSFLRALDAVDSLKSDKPILGDPVELDYDAVRYCSLADDPTDVETVTDELVERLRGMFILGHPRSQMNVGSAPTIPSIIGGLLPAIYNPNLVSEEASRSVALVEAEAIAMTSRLLGYDQDRSAGVFTFGGTGTLLYAAKIGLEKACPGIRKKGVREDAVIVCSDQAHYACLTAANWLGLGEDQLVRVPTSDANEVQLGDLEAALRELIRSGRRIACIVATMATTDAFGLDDLGAMRKLRDSLVDEFRLDYTPHLHADAVIGWAWSVFNDYPFEENPLGFPPRTLRALAGTRRRIRRLPLADSIGVDFHKTGFTPYVSSAFITRDAADLGLVARDAAAMPYLFHSGNWHPGKVTLETSRSGAGPMAALANLRLFGKRGLQSLLGHLVSVAESLREQLESRRSISIVNRDNFGPVTLLRVYPNDVDTFSMPTAEREDPALREKLLQNNQYNRRIFEILQDKALQGDGVLLSLTECYRKTAYGEPIVAIKSYVMSPFSMPENSQAVVDSIMLARESVSSPDQG